MNQKTPSHELSSVKLRFRRLRKWLGLSGFVICMSLLVLFIANGTDKSWMNPKIQVNPTVATQPKKSDEIRILALNIAKCSAFTGIREFSTVDEVKSRLDAIAGFIEKEQVDLVFLSEVVNECALCPLDQVEYLGKKGGFSSWVASDNYRFGIPYFRIRSGNAILSRLPLQSASVMALKGKSSIWNPTNNRRLLWAEVLVNSKPLLVGSIRNDSFNLANNEKQVTEILSYLGKRSAILAGDFNAQPEDPSMKMFQAAKKFSGNFLGDLTYPTRKPWRRIDYILAPKTWQLIEERVPKVKLSDHLPVVASFRIPLD